MNKSPLILIFLGKAGSGKGTQVNFLKEKLDLDFLGTGELLRLRKKTNDFSGKKIASVIDNGGIVPAPVVFELWMQKFEEFKNRGDFKGVILDGSPRKLREAWLMDDALGWFEWDKRVKIMLIDISDEEAIKRTISRKTCSKCGNIIMYSKETAGIENCPQCGEKLIVRPDDTIEGVKNRLKWFEEQVGETIRHYESMGRLIRINGEQSVENVFNDIMKEVEKNDND
jgi:adenylate kinase